MSTLTALVPPPALPSLPVTLFQPQPLEKHRGRTETGEGALDQIDPDKDAQPDKPGCTQAVSSSESSNMQPATILTPLSTVMTFSLFNLDIANLASLYTIEPNISNC